MVNPIYKKAFKHLQPDSAGGQLLEKIPLNIFSLGLITWEEVHIAASMKPKLYHLLEHRAANCRHFVIPLWRGSGYATMFAPSSISN
ncbi:hypothetical protein CK203_025701 [Vitis vinifera]|uniref:Uncharacterized protein n=1 Tax=Vitis vinifera TaxID=29760 RepID=A0A438IGF3_VITVI|nr:hypothetical protein CK203_025701 [Vitis vinifera]